jgi:pimeloyl-ACP methyl ester carboxylesterase
MTAFSAARRRACFPAGIWFTLGDAATEHDMSVDEQPVEIDVPSVGVLRADWTTVRPGGPLVVFAHGSGSGRHSPRNRAVAARLQEGGFGTLLLDLLTDQEEEVEHRGGRLRFDVDQLADRLIAAVEWVDGRVEPPPGMAYFGASTGAAGALVAAVRQQERISAVVSRGGRPDLAGDLLPLVTAPTLLIVGGHDRAVLGMNQRALRQLRAPARLEVVPWATHLFEEPGTLEQVAELAVGWFSRYLIA